MNLIQIVLVLAIFGFILYLVNQYIPMSQPIKTAINVIAVILLVLWVLDLFGIGSIPVVRR